MPTIPISRLVNVTPSSLGVSNGVNFINGLILSQNSILKVGTLKEYETLQDVSKDFPTNSQEYLMAEVYFTGFTGANSTPNKLLFYGVSTTHNTETSENNSTETHQLTLTDVMNNLVNISQDFTGFTTSWEPNLAEKQELARWTASQELRYWYVCWDTDPQALIANNSPSFGAWLLAQNIDGTTALYADALCASLCLSWMASLNFDATNGRTTLAQRRSGLVSPSVTDATSATTLKENGYSFYGAYANGLGRFQFLEDGAVSGQFLWADSYINQIWLNASFQSNLLSLLLNTGQIPYNAQGDGLISASVQDTIQQAINFGAIRSGVSLSAQQKQQIDNNAGVTISNIIETRGWYFQPNASTAPSDIRVSRKSPACKFWYTDGQSVQMITLSSVEAQ